MRRIQSGRHWEETWGNGCQDPCAQSSPNITAAIFLEKSQCLLGESVWRKQLPHPLEPWLPQHSSQPQLRRQQHRQIQGVSERGFGAWLFPTISQESNWFFHLKGKLIETPYKNTLLVSGRPELWALEARSSRLLGTLFCQVQGIIWDRLRCVALVWGNTPTILPEV